MMVLFAKVNMCRAGEELAAHYEQLIYWVVKTNNEIEQIRKIKYLQYRDVRNLLLNLISKKKIFHRVYCIITS